MLSKIIVFIILISFTLSDEQVERGLNWYESLPAVAMDYKVHIDAGKLVLCFWSGDVFIINFAICSTLGKEDCYHQYVAAGATFYVSMQVCQLCFH